MDDYSPTARTRVRRLPKRASYDRPTVHRILDEGFLCHVGFAVDSQPYVIPTVYARAEETLYVHGSAASRMLRTLTQQVPVCVTVTLLDALVLARSAFHHSLNYRSVVVIGNARLVDDPEEKLRALRWITNHVAPRRWEEVRAPNALELRQSSVLAVPLCKRCPRRSAAVRRLTTRRTTRCRSGPAWCRSRRCSASRSMTGGCRRASPRSIRRDSRVFRPGTARTPLGPRRARTAPCSRMRANRPLAHRMRNMI